jgi:uncharacterized membrane protein YkoI
MNLSPRRGPALLGITLASTAAFALGGAVVLAARAGTGAPSAYAEAAAAQAGAVGHSATAVPLAAATTSTPPATSTPPPTTVVASTSGGAAPRKAQVTPEPPAAQPLTLSQAVALAGKRVNGRLERVDVNDGPRGRYFEVELTRRDGADVEVLVRGRTARVVSVDRDSDDTAPRARATMPLSLSQAVELASKRANGRLEKVEVKDGLRGPYYAMELTRRDGTDVEVIVQGRTARVTDVDRDTDDGD